MKTLIAVIVLQFVPGAVLAADYPARVVGISNGDTLTVLKADKARVKIRLAGIDAPRDRPGLRPQGEVGIKSRRGRKPG